MSDHQPAGGAEYLERHGGEPLPPEPGEPRAGRRSRRTTWLVGGGVVAALAIGVGAWAGMSFFGGQGPQPATALPSSTVLYASVDLDPSGSQKIDAFRTLNKFPAFEDKLGLHTVDDVRRKIGQELIDGTGCDLSYDAAIGPWLGSRAAVAAVDLGGADPHPVLAVQVTDESKAEAGLRTLTTCGDHPPKDVGFDVTNGWAILAETQDLADQTIAATAEGSLADDTTYQKWTSSVGDAGIVNVYAAPAAGDYLAKQLDGLAGAFSGLGGVATSTTPGIASSDTAGQLSAQSSVNGLTDALKSFRGAAATVRFSGSGLEFASASDPGLAETSLGSDQGGAVVSRLPDDTAAAIGLGMRPGWFDAVVSRMATVAGGGQSPDALVRKLSQESGLDLPADAETLLGTSAAMSVGKDFDFEKATYSSDGAGIPAALTVQGDPTAISRLLDKVRAHPQFSTTALGSDSSGDLTAIGPTAAYRQQLLAGGHLGDTDAFRGVLPDAGHASFVLYLDLDALTKSLSQATGDDAQINENLAPLRALGLSAWMDGDVARTSLQVSTD